MMRRLLCNIITFCMVWVVPVACEGLAKNRVQGFLDPSVVTLAKKQRRCGADNLRRFYVPATQVELDNRHKAFHRIINLRHWQQSIRMRHETVVRESVRDGRAETVIRTSLSFPTSTLAPK